MKAMKRVGRLPEGTNELRGLNEQEVALVKKELLSTLAAAHENGVPGLGDPNAGTWDRAIVLAEFTEGVRESIRESVLGMIRTPVFREKIATIVATCAQEIAKEIVAEDLPELEARVRAIVKDRWDERVTAAAHELLQSKLDELKRKL